jgi:hypothetical protein
MPLECVMIQRNLEAEHHLSLAHQHRSNGNHEESEAAFKSAYESYLITQHKVNAAEAAMQVANTLIFGLHKPCESVHWYRISASLYEELGFDHWVAANMANEANAWLQVGEEIPHALACFQKAHDMLGMPIGRGHFISLEGISDCLFHLGKRVDALDALAKGLNKAYEIGDFHWIQKFRGKIQQVNPKHPALERESETCSAAYHVMREEQRFAEQWGAQIHGLADYVRSRAISAAGSDNRIIEIVASTPISSFPTQRMNAVVCALSSGDMFINVSPDLVVSLRYVAEFTSAYFDRKADLMSGIQKTLCKCLDSYRRLLVPNIYNWEFYGRPLFEEGIDWILLHEIGHIKLGHLDQAKSAPLPMKGATESGIRQYIYKSRQKELRADAFATDQICESFIRSTMDIPRSEVEAVITVGTVLGALSALSIAQAPERQRSEESTHPEHVERFDRSVSQIGDYFSHTADLAAFSNIIRSLWFSEMSEMFFRMVGVDYRRRSRQS